MNTTLIRQKRLAASLVFLSALAGCLGGSTEPVNVSGSYELRSINGTAVPYTFSNGITVIKETLSLYRDGTFTDVTTRADGTVVSDQGAYTNVGGTVNFGDQTAGLIYQGAVNGTQLSTTIGTFTSTFVKTGDVTH